MIAIDKRLREIRKSDIEGPFKYEKPVRSGWERDFTLRADIANRSDADAFRYVLSKINNIKTSPHRSFRRRSYENRKVWVPIEQALHPLSVEEWEKFSAEDAKYSAYFRKYFVKKLIRKGFRTTYGIDVADHYVYSFDFPWIYTFRIRPHYITHYWTVDPEVDKEKAALDKELEALGGWRYYGYLKSGRNDLHRDEWYTCAMQIKHARQAGVKKAGGNPNSMKKAIRRKNNLDRKSILEQDTEI